MNENDTMKIQLDLYGRLKIKPKGRSMLPFLKEGRNAVVAVKPEKPIKKYDIALYKQNGVYVLHRVVKIGADAYTICGDNSAVLEHVEKQRIIGVAEKIITHGREYSADNFFIMICVRAWYRLGIKRVVMKIKKLFVKSEKNLIS